MYFMLQYYKCLTVLNTLTLNILVVLSSAVIPLFTIEWKSGITTVQDIFTHIQSPSPTVRMTTFLQNLQKFAVDIELHINSDNIFPSYFTACSFHLRLYTKATNSLIKLGFLKKR